MHWSRKKTKEFELINSIKIDKCKHCESYNVCKRGFTCNKVQRYFCNDCNKTFTALTNTIFENHKISITEWIEYILDIFNYGSTTLASKVNNCQKVKKFYKNLIKFKRIRYNLW